MIPESKQEAKKEWCEFGSSTPKPIRVQKSVKKVLAPAF